MKSRQCRNDVFDDPIGKVLLFRITAHILKRQDRNRWLVGQRQTEASRRRHSGQRSRPCRGRTAELKRINTHRLGDVLESGLAKIADRKIEPRFHLPEGILRKTDGSRLSNALQARRNIDAVAHQVAVAFLDNIAEMNADAKFDAPLWRQAGIALDQRVLNLDAAPHRFDDTPKFHNDSIAGPLYDASVVDGDRWIDQVASKCAQPCQRAVLVRSRQATEPDDICREYRSKLSQLTHAHASGLGIFARGMLPPAGK